MKYKNLLGWKDIEGGYFLLKFLLQFACLEQLLKFIKNQIILHSGR